MAHQFQRPLADDIVTTTRAVHARVNKLITARLPLALPPRAADPGAYISGMLHFAPIYMAFEQLWQAIIDTTPTRNTADGSDAKAPLSDHDHVILFATGDAAPENSRPAASERVHTVLKALHLPGLIRSSRLKADIQALTGWTDDVYDEQIKTTGETGHVGEFIRHIARAVHNKPHVLVAYSYIMLMALFAGGRFIRASFENAGDEFWDAVPSPIRPTLQTCEPNAACKPENEASRMEASQADLEPNASHKMPLRFWRFSTAEDGEDLKRGYKENLFDSEDKLTAQERHDIVQESIYIFESIGSIVGQLDKVWQEEETKPSPIQGSRLSTAGLLKSPFGARLRDSFLVTRERSAKHVSQQPSSSESDVNAASIKGWPDAAVAAEEEEEDDDDDDADAPAGIELCPGIPKSMRFAKSLPIPPRRHRPTQEGIGQLDGGLDDGLKMASRSRRGASVARWAWAGTLGLAFLFALLAKQLGFKRLAVA